MTQDIRTVLVTGGAGYVGAVLVPKLLARGYRVKVLDLYLFGDDVLPKRAAGLEEIRGDIRNQELLRASLRDVDAVIHRPQQIDQLRRVRAAGRHRQVERRAALRLCVDVERLRSQ